MFFKVSLHDRSATSVYFWSSFFRTDTKSRWHWRPSPRAITDTSCHETFLLWHSVDFIRVSVCECWQFLFSVRWTWRSCWSFDGECHRVRVEIRAGWRAQKCLLSSKYFKQKQKTKNWWARSNATPLTRYPTQWSHLSSMTLRNEVFYVKLRVNTERIQLTVMRINRIKLNVVKTVRELFDWIHFVTGRTKTANAYAHYPR